MRRWLSNSRKHQKPRRESIRLHICPMPRCRGVSPLPYVQYRQSNRALLGEVGLSDGRMEVVAHPAPKATKPAATRTTIAPPVAVTVASRHMRPEFQPPR